MQFFKKKNPAKIRILRLSRNVSVLPAVEASTLATFSSINENNGRELIFFFILTIFNNIINSEPSASYSQDFQQSSSGENKRVKVEFKKEVDERQENSATLRSHVELSEFQALPNDFILEGSKSNFILLLKFYYPDNIF